MKYIQGYFFVIIKSLADPIRTRMWNRQKAGQGIFELVTDKDVCSCYLSEVF